MIISDLPRDDAPRGGDNRLGLHDHEACPPKGSP
jgi:hypothetical protein